MELQITQTWYPLSVADGRTDGQTDGRPDGRSGPTTRPAFAKATQVKTTEALKSHNFTIFMYEILYCMFILKILGNILSVFQ